ncbi:hypothetical protein GGS23DRAFT_353586 [Durotheca rogersii]|uniref:uncharacterized protein n=1 Tax=Durotheca rogersii TaxID=419775 RepID=UPI00221E7ACB|nr:uncharacterized protein GGS23DRAFT_353586 [Durotheca rogersii]KAI5865745.1 hypothetical protein GGS23DRAFT_353586 [Durotheca rogersii]
MGVEEVQVLTQGAHDGGATRFVSTTIRNSRVPVSRDRMSLLKYLLSLSHLLPSCSLRPSTSFWRLGQKTDCQTDSSSWLTPPGHSKILPYIFAVLNSSTHETTHLSPFRILYGIEPRQLYVLSNPPSNDFLTTQSQHRHDAFDAIHLAEARMKLIYNYKYPGLGDLEGYAYIEEKQRGHVVGDPDRTSNYPTANNWPSADQTRL